MRTALVQATTALGGFRSAVSSASTAGGRLRDAAKQNNTQLKNMSESADKAARHVGTAGKNAATGGGTFKKLSGGLKGAATAQKGLNTAMKGNALGLLLGLLAPLVDKLVDMAMKSKPVQDALKRVGEIGDKAMRVLTAGGKAVLDWVKKHWPLLLGILTGPVGLAVLAIMKNLDKIKAGAGAAKDWFVQKFNDLVAFATGLPGRINRGTSGMWNGMKDAFRASINGILRGWNGLEFRVPGIGVGPFHTPGFTLGLPDVPLLAQGGIALPTLGGRLVRVAEAGQAEAIVPLSRLPELLNAADARRRSDAPITINVHPRPGQSEYEIGRITARELAWAAKR